MSDQTLVRIVIDQTVPPGKFRTGGVRIASPADDAALGRELRTVEVGCNGDQEASNLRRIVQWSDGLEMA